MNKINKYQLALNTYDLINKYLESGEDYSLLQRCYNELIDNHELDLPKIRFISVDEYEYI